MLTEFFCGLGGVSEAIDQLNAAHPQQSPLHPQQSPLRVVRAIDIDRDCAAVYEHNFDARVERRSIESMNLRDLAATHPEQTWWMSPPCQPYCRRGRGVPQDDRRCDAIRAIIRFLSYGKSLPTVLVLENVPEFALSQDAFQLSAVLQRRGYATWSGDLCPTQFGIPNLRNRHYLIARLGAEAIAPPAIPPRRDIWNFTIASILETDPEPLAPLLLDPSIVAAYRTAMDLVDPQQASARAACFGGGYGKSIIRSGSYVVQGERVRHFSPREVARLLGFSPRYRFPDAIPTRRRWKMLGNSVSITVVKAVLASALHLDRVNGP